MSKRGNQLSKSIFTVFALLTLALSANAQQYKSLLWKISGNDLKDPSYLFGTMHSGDARVLALSDKAMPYLSSCKAYAMELDPAEAFNMDLIGKLMMGKGGSLSKLLPDKEYRFLDSIVQKQTGFSMALFDNVAPIFVMTLLETQSLGLTDSVINGKVEVLDVYLYGKAKERGKKVIGIETSGEQLEALSALSYKDQADLLTQEIDSLLAGNQDTKDIAKYYLNQQLDSLADHDDDTKKPEKFYKTLVLDRNVRMADRIAKFIKQQTTFVAIGAMHLPGEQGVIQLLRKKGYKVEPVKDLK